MTLKKYPINSAKETFKRVRKELLDPLAVDLANDIHWLKINHLNQEEDYEYPVVITGQGSPVLMLHGFDSCFLEFRRLVPLLKKNHKIIIPDLFGFGFCPRPLNIEYGRKNIISHLKEVIEQTYKGESMGLIGASMGGAIAMDLARVNPEKIHRILLLSPAGLTGKQTPLPPIIDKIGVWFLKQNYVRKALCKQAFAYPENSVGEFEEQIASIHLKVPGWQNSLTSFARQGGIANCGTPIPTQPLEILWGEQDRILKGKVERDTFELYANCIEKINHCGHLPHLDRPEVVAEKWLRINQ